MVLLTFLFAGFKFARPQDSPERFLISIDNGIATGMEEFKIEKSDIGYRLTGTTRFTQSGGLAIWTQEQVLAADWSPVSYRLELESLGRKEIIETAKEGDQFQMRADLGTFIGRDKSVPVRPRTIILDDIVASHFQVLLNAIASDKESKSEWHCLVPRARLAIEGKLLGTKNASGTLNGKSIQIRKYTLQVANEVKEFWAEADTYRLMRVLVLVPEVEMVRVGFALTAAAVDSDNAPTF